MRTGDSPVHYLLGTPKGRLSKFEKKFLTLPWQAVRPSVDVKLLSHDSELYILARSHPRTLKERAMRRRRLKKLWRRLHELQQQTLTRDALLLKLGAAKKEAGRAYHLVDIQIPDPKQPITLETFTFSLRRDKLRTVRRREGRYLLRSNLRDEDPATLWQYYIRLTEIEQAFKELKHDLARTGPLLRFLQHQAPSQRTGPTHPRCGVLRPGSPRFGSLKPEEDSTYRTVQFPGSISFSTTNESQRPRNGSPGFFLATAWPLSTTNCPISDRSSGVNRYTLSMIV